LGCQQTVGSSRRAAAHQRAQDGNAALQAGFVLQPARQQHRFARVTLSDALHFRAHRAVAGSLLACLLARRPFHKFHQFLRPRVFRHSHQREVSARFLARANRRANQTKIIWKFRDENDVRSGCQAGAQGQPSGADPREFHNHDAVGGVRAGMQAVNRLRCDFAGGIKPDGFIRSGNVVIRCLGQYDDIQAGLAQVQPGFNRFLPAYANQRVKFVALVSVHRVLGHVRAAVRARHSLGDIAADAKDGPPQGQDARKHPTA